ncbi:MAG: NAD(P)H-dependent oxidoreductase [Phycisphaerae bacterium]|nr:NAD(P)H-dependent oxidoreductase [Phycisphaerae bacterium]
MSEILVVYYSRTGKTRMVAERLAALLGADIEEIREQKDRSGALHFLGACKDTLLNRPARLASEHSVEGRSTVVIGMPVWAGRVPPPVRAYLDSVGLTGESPGKKVCAFCTHGGGGGKGTFAELRNRLGELAEVMEWKKPRSDDPSLQAAMEDFAERIGSAGG